jgi:hypothetical protein
MDVMLVAHYKGAAYVQTLPKTEAEKRINKRILPQGWKAIRFIFQLNPNNFHCERTSNTGHFRLVLGEFCV